MNINEISRGSALMTMFGVNNLDELIEAIESDVAEGKTLIAIGKIRKAMSIYAMSMQPSFPPQKSDKPCTIHSTDMEGNCFKCNVKGMKITGFIHYLDGGTVLFKTTQGDYAYDYRITTNTKGEIYQGYPEKDNSNKVTDYLVIDNLSSALKDFVQESIDKNKTDQVNLLKAILDKTY
jgi:hypothetical protein